MTATLTCFLDLSLTTECDEASNLLSQALNVTINIFHFRSTRRHAPSHETPRTGLGSVSKNFVSTQKTQKMVQAGECQNPCFHPKQSKHGCQVAFLWFALSSALRAVAFVTVFVSDFEETRLRNWHRQHSLLVNREQCHICQSTPQNLELYSDHVMCDRSWLWTTGIMTEVDIYR